MRRYFVPVDPMVPSTGLPKQWRLVEVMDDDSGYFHMTNGKRWPTAAGTMRSWIERCVFNTGACVELSLERAQAFAWYVRADAPATVAEVW